MPDRPMRPCTGPNCPALVKSGRCPDHARAESRRINEARGSAASRGYGAAWRAIAATVLSEEPLCRACAVEGIITPADTVDHVIPKSRGGTDGRANLQALCRSCNSRKRDREVRFGPANPDPLAVASDRGAR